MHVTISQTSLARALALVAPVAADGAAGVRLDHLRLHAVDSVLELVATDLTSAVRIRAPAVVWEAGAVTVPARLLLNLVAGLPDGEVVLTADDRHQLTIRAGRTRSAVAGGAPDDFPILPVAHDLPPVAQVDGRELHELISGVIVASLAEHDVRPALAAVRVEFAPLALVACDGVRLALRRRGGSAHANGVHADIPAVTAPRRALPHLMRLLRHAPGALTLAQDPDRGLLFATTTDGAEWMARLIEGVYPDYRALIPTATGTTIIVPRAELRLALRRGAAFDPLARLVRLDAQPATTGGGGLTVTAQGQATGDSASELVAAVLGEPATTWLDAGLLDGLLGAMDATTVELGLGAPMEPCLVRPAGREDHLALLMPCRPGPDRAPAGDGEPARAVSEGADLTPAGVLADGGPISDGEVG